MPAQAVSLGSPDTVSDRPERRRHTPQSVASQTPGGATFLRLNTQTIDFQDILRLQMPRRRTARSQGHWPEHFVSHQGLSHIRMIIIPHRHIMDKKHRIFIKNMVCPRCIMQRYATFQLLAIPKNNDSPTNTSLCAHHQTYIHYHILPSQPSVSPALPFIPSRRSRPRESHQSLMTIGIYT